MSATQMLTGDALTVKRWGLSGWLNIGGRKAFGHVMDRGAVHFCNEFLGQGLMARGDQITYEYINKLTGIPQGEGGVLDGNEEAINLGSFSMAMNVTRIGVLSPNKDTIEQQRTMVDFEPVAKKLITPRHAELLDTAVFYHAAGANPTSFTLDGTTWSGTDKLFPFAHNTPVAPTSDRIIRAGGVANDESLTSSNTFTLDLIDYALEKNDRSDQPIERFDDGTFDCYVSPEQLVDIQHDSSGKVQWLGYQLAKVTGGKGNEMDKGLSDGGLIVACKYRDVYIYSSRRTAYGVNSSTSAVITTVRRAVMMGKDALVFASPFGGRATDKNVPLRFSDQLKDYGYYKGIEGRFIGGLKKNTPSNGQDVGTMVISTYAAAHA